MPIVDVRDIADAHIAVAFIPEAAGRHILNGSNTDMLEMTKVIAEKYAPPKYPVPAKEAPVPKVLLWALAPYIIELG